MDSFFDLITTLTDDNPTLVMSLLVFLAVATVAFLAMAGLRVRGEVKRRTAGVTLDGGPRADDKRSLRYASRRAAQRLIDYTTRHYSPKEGGGDQRQLRMRLMQAGFLDSRAVAFFFLARIMLAIGLAATAFFAAPLICPES